MDMNAERIMELGIQGYCCSQIMVLLGLEIQEKTNPDLVQSVAGLCGGMCSGETCGVITGAACMLSLFDKELATGCMIPELVDWFRHEYTGLFGGIKCSDIIDGDGGNKLRRCPVIMAATYARALKILEQNGFIDQEMY